MDGSTTAFTNNGNKKITNNVKNESIESIPYVRLKLQYPKNVIFHPIDNRGHNNDHDYKEELLIDDYDSNRVFLLYLIIRNILPKFRYII